MKQPVQRHLSSLHHIALPVADLESSVRWYMTSFSCEVIYQDKIQAILQFENIKLSLVLPSHQPFHLAFPRTDANTLGEITKRQDGTLSTYVSDPTGNVVEVLQIED